MYVTIDWNDLMLHAEEGCGHIGHIMSIFEPNRALLSTEELLLVPLNITELF